MEYDMAFDRVKAVYAAKDKGDLNHGTMVVGSVQIVTKELELVRCAVAAGPADVWQLAQNYIDMAVMDLNEINKRLTIFNGCLQAVEASAAIGQGAVEISESFVSTTALVIVALCINAYRLLAFARALVDEACAKQHNKTAN